MLQQSDERAETYRYLRTKYQELHEQFTRLRKGYLLIVCAWCQQRIRWMRNASAVAGDTSHGLCPACATDLCRKIQARKHAPGQ